MAEPRAPRPRQGMKPSFNSPARTNTKVSETLVISFLADDIVAAIQQTLDAVPDFTGRSRNCCSTMTESLRARSTPAHR